MVLIRPLNPTAVSEGSALPLLFEVAFHVTTNTDLQSAHPTHTHTTFTASCTVHQFNAYNGNVLRFNTLAMQQAGSIIFHHYFYKTYFPKHATRV